MRTLKEELEILRGEPIQVFTGDPMDIPCVETSDSEKLCKHPVVSVNMITYNHEPYIRQAIEGVMMQKTDFEFELVIGEDCSTDKTREICFEYQKRYPDKIRVLWCDHNLYRNPHSAGGNYERNTAHCRGEFVALCEGDDYWTDALKLQKQIAELRRTNAVMCVASCEWHYPDGRIRTDCYSMNKESITPEIMCKHYFHTTTIVLRRNALNRCYSTYPEIPYWYDNVLERCMSTVGRVAYLPDVVSVYNWTGNGCGGREGDWRRMILQLTQYIELYLWGPHAFKEIFSRQILQVAISGVAIECASPVDVRCDEIKRSLRRIAVHIAYDMGGVGNVAALAYRLICQKYSAQYKRHPRFQKLYRFIKKILRLRPEPLDYQCKSYHWFL